MFSLSLSLSIRIFPDEGVTLDEALDACEALSSGSCPAKLLGVPDFEEVNVAVLPQDAEGLFLR